MKLLSCIDINWPLTYTHLVVLINVNLVHLAEYGVAI